MMTSYLQLRHLVSGLLSIVTAGLGQQLTPAQAEPDSNPIAKLARILSPQLMEVEDRISTLDQLISTYPKPSQYALKVGLGYRGCRTAPTAVDPSITVDLGRELPIECLFLVPAEPEFAGDPAVFPRRFTLELAHRADFAPSTRLYTSGTTVELPPNGVPAVFPAKETARYVRLTVQEGHHLGATDLFGLSEIVVISMGEPVSFGAAVSTVGAFNTPGIWYPDALTDGRMPLGIWQHGQRPPAEAGDVVALSSATETTSWTIQLDADAPLDRLVLFPYQAKLTCGLPVLPEALTVSLALQDGEPGEPVVEWTSPLPGSNPMTPLVIALHGQAAKTIRLTATRPFVMGDRLIHALAEIEVWSQGTNLARGRVALRVHGGQTSSVATLTDGYSSEKQIIPVALWFRQLREYERIERELTPLRTMQRELASNSELNATWGSAMFLGLTFLIPVFIIERRRLVSTDHLDQIRKRISADLHDDIGSNLGSISLIARTARKDLIRLQGPPQIATDLAEMETISRESSLAMRDIVWLLERKQDSIGDLVQRMRETASRLLREITFTLDCDSQKTAAKLSLDAKRHLFLFYKESIHNVLKHSHATSVSIRLWDQGEQLALEILDNGIGIPINTDARPEAVNKLEDRARLLHGNLQITSTKETGTQIRLLVKRSHLTTHSILT